MITKQPKFSVPLIVFGLAFGICLVGCRTEPQMPDSLANIAQKAVWHQIALDTLPAPDTLILDRTQIIKAGKPTVAKFRNNEVKTNQRTVSISPPIIRSVNPPDISSLTIHKKKAKLPIKKAAQPSVNPVYNPYNFNTFDLESGLFDNKVHRTFQDSKGNIWLGSFGGLTKYNGKTNEIYTPEQGFKDPYIIDIEEDNNGTLWVASDKVLEIFDGEYISELTDANEKLFDGITDVLLDKNGTAWITTLGNGLINVDFAKKRFTKYGSKQGLSDSINCIAVDKLGNKWLGTHHDGLIKWNGEKSNHYTTSNGLAGNNISAITAASSGRIWLGGNGSISEFTENDVTIFSKINRASVSNITEDKSGIIWFTMLSGGVFRIKDNIMANIGVKDGLPSNEAYHVMEDNLGNVWISTYNGAVKYNKMFQTLTKKDGLASSVVRCMSQDKKQNLWLGSELGGASYVDFENQTISNYFADDGLISENIVSVLVDSQESIWFGNFEGQLSKLDKERKTFTHFLDSGDYIVNIYEDDQGDIWYSPRRKGGVVQIKKSTNVAIHYSTAQGLTDDEVIQIKQDKAGNYIFSTFAGVSVLSKDKKLLTNYPQTPTQNLQIVESCTEDQTGALWFSTLTGGGLYRLDRKTQTIRKFTMDDGLPSNTLFGSIIDKKGNIWLNARTGLVKIDAKNTNNFDKLIEQPNPILFKNFTKEDGYFGHGDGRSYITLDKYNRLWNPMAKNLRIVDLNEEQTPQSGVNAELTAVGLFNEKFNWKRDSAYVLSNGIRVNSVDFDSLSAWNQIPQGLKLPYNNNHLNFSFVAVNSASATPVQYEYQLAGFDPDWNKTISPEAVYTNLSAGQYVFKIRAMDALGGWSETLAYPFSILPPWWLTWWAKTLYVIIATAGIYLFTKFRLNQQLKKVKELEAIRTKISADLHDDVGSILSGLSMQSQMIALTASTDLKKSLLELSDMSHDAMDSMRDTVWAIDPRKDKVENLIDRMRSFAEKNLSLKNIKHQFDIDFDNPKAFINPEKRQNCYLIFKEAITNICKHSNAKFVKITFRKVKDEIRLIIHDDGSEKESYVSDGSGMNNMKMRATKINGSLVTKYKDGFKVLFTFDKD